MDGVKKIIERVRQHRSEHQLSLYYWLIAHKFEDGLVRHTSAKNEEKSAVEKAVETCNARILSELERFYKYDELRALTDKKIGENKKYENSAMMAVQLKAQCKDDWDWNTI